MLHADQILHKLRKYILYISIVFFVATGSHLIYQYLYSGSKSIPVKGGSISEAIIGDIPHLNPLLVSTDYNKYINSITYRSLLQYSLGEEKYVSDIASCDLKNLLQVECFLQNDAKWSDGTDITISDIIATFEVLKTPGVNPVISSLLSTTTIEAKERSLVFKNETGDITFLNILLQPILPEKEINILGADELSGKFTIGEKLYSGPYTVASLEQDDNLGIRRLTLEKNKYYTKKDFFIDKIVFKIFEDVNQFVKHKDSVNIFNDKTNIIAGAIPRLEPYEYILPQYVGLYLNVEKIPELSLRSFILNQISSENIVKSLSEHNFKVVQNPFITDESIQKDVGQNMFVQVMQQRGFLQKSELLKTPVQKEKTISAEASVSSAKIQITPSKIITSPEVNNINFVSSDDILLKGKVDSSDVSAVYINEYQLKGFRPGDGEFYYRLKEQSYETIKQGKNEYSIYFEIAGNKKLQETLVFYYFTDATTLEAEKLKVLNTPISSPVIEEVKGELSTTTGALDGLGQLEKIEALDDGYYYNQEYNKFTLTLYYLETEKSLVDTANIIQKTLAQYGINVELVGLALSDLSELLKKGDKNYDMILAGVNLGYFDYNLSPYFHSSQIKNGYNFSNFKKLSLDILLEELRSSVLSQEKTHEIETKILTILREEQFMKTLYTPVLRNLVDKNVKNYSLKNYILDDSLRFQGLDSAYIEEKKIIDATDKGFFHFFVFLKNTFFE